MLPPRSRLKKLAKKLGLKLLILGKPLFPRSFILYTFSRLTNIRLEFEDEKSKGEITICKYKYGAKGALCVSIDFDLPVSRPLRTDWREATTEILRLTEKYEVPISWGICGILALNESEIFKQIRSSTVLHDLGVHTFTHTDFSSSECTNNIAKDEIFKCIEVLKGKKRPVTFIFPWNRLGHLPLLREYGFVAYRGNKTAKLAYPYKVQQLWDVHGTYYLVERSAEEVSVLPGLLDSAISYGCVLHLWSHPWDMSIDGNVEKFMEKVLDPLLSYAAKKKNDGLLWICTMRELANYCEVRESCRIERLEKMKDRISFSVHCAIKDPRFDFPPTVTLQIQVPRRWTETRVYVNNIRQEFTTSCFIAKRNRKSYLFLTLSFEKPSHEVHLVKANS